MKITSTTKRMIVGFMGSIGLIAMIGCAWGKIEYTQASAVIFPLFTGFFSLLKGED